MSYTNMCLEILQGSGKTLLIFFSTLIISLPLGMIIMFGRRSKFKPLSLIIQVIISILRGTPLMLQLIVWFYGPYYLWGATLSNNWRLWAVILGFGINYAAYFAEIYRSGIQSIPIGQTEAAKILGYTPVQRFFKIILPQMIRRVLPAITNEIITLVKDTSLAFVLTYIEMFTIAKQIAAAQTTIIPLFIAGLFYFIFNGVVASTMNFIEKKMSYY